MKVNRLLIAVLSVVMLGMVACKEKNAPSGPGQQEEKPTDTTTVVIPENVDIPANAITVAEAREICAGLESGATTGDKYYVKGWVKKLHSKHASGVADYGNAQFYMVDKIGDTDDFMAYQVYGLNGQKLTSADQVEVGDYVVVYGELTKYTYNGTDTYETVGKGAAYIYSSSNAKIADAPQPQGPVTNFTYVTIAEALKIGEGLAADAETEAYYMDTVIITTVKTAAENVPGKYTNINMTVKDATGSMDSYYTNYLDNAAFTSADQIPPVNSKVILIAKIAKFKETTIEFKNGYIAKILEVGDGKIEPEIKGDVVFMPTAKQMPEGWSMLLEGVVKDAVDKDFYSDNSFKCNALNKGVQSPKFDGGEAVKVSFVISKLNEKKDVTDPSDGMFDIYALDADGNVLVSNSVSGVNAEGTYSAELQIAGSQIAAVQVVMTAFPHNGKVQCNAALKEVVIEKIANE